MKFALSTQKSKPIRLTGELLRKKIRPGLFFKEKGHLDSNLKRDKKEKETFPLLL